MDPHSSIENGSDATTHGRFGMIAHGRDEVAGKVAGVAGKPTAHEASWLQKASAVQAAVVSLQTHGAGGVKPVAHGGVA